jgi:hypothetical protein
MTNAAAMAAGYISTSTYPYTPPNGTGATIAAGLSGTTMAAICAGIPSDAVATASAACLNDTTVGVIYNFSNHTVTAPDRTSLAHPSGGSAWDSGAYQYGVGVAAPGVGLTPSPLPFGNQVQSTTSAGHSVTLTNTGTADLTIAGITITGTNAGDFAQSNTLPVGSGFLAPFTSGTITVTFTPGATGARSASISISDNAGGGTHTVALSGTGIASGGGGGGGGTGTVGGARCSICFSQQGGIQNQAYTYVPGGGTANTQTATLTPAPQAYAAGQSVFWMPNAANTSGTPTLNLDGLGNKTIVKAGGAALSASPPDLTTTAIAWAIYDGTNFELQNPQTAPSAATTTIASGTSALGTSAIASGACATVVTTTATGTAATDNIQADFNADPTSTLGYEAGAMLTIIKYPTSGNVNFKVCNNTGSSITPGAATLNWRVVR